MEKEKVKTLARTALALLLLALLSSAARSRPEAPAAELLATVETGNDLAIVAAWSPDGQQLAYGTEKEVRARRSPLEVDGDMTRYPGEVWVTDFREKPQRILKHDFFRSREGNFFSFSVERMAWSPDGEKLAVELTDERKNTVTFFLTAKGKGVKLGSSRQNFVLGYGGAWLGDNETLALLSEAVEPRLLHRVLIVRVTAGRRLSLFDGRTFAAVAWLPQASQMVAVERDPQFLHTPRLVRGDLERGTLETLDDNLDHYLGGLQTSPDETRASYFVAQEKLVVRSLDADASEETWPVPFGRYAWAGSRRAVLYLEPKELGARSGWLTLYDPARGEKLRVLSEETIQDFWVAPEGDRVAVLTVGLKPQMKIYRLALPSTTP